MRVLLKLLLLIVCFLSTTLINTSAAEIDIVQNLSKMNNAEVSVLNDNENYFIVANNNNYEISIARKDSNNNYNNDRNNSIHYLSEWNVHSFAKSSPNDFGKNYKISSYLKNIVCIRAP